LNGEPRTARRVRLGLVLTSAALITSACAAGKDSQTSEENPTMDGSNAEVGKIDLRGIAIATPTAEHYFKGNDAMLVGVIANAGDDDDTLTGISTTAAASWGEFDTAKDAQSVIAVDQTGSAATATSVPQPKTSVPITAGARLQFVGQSLDTGAIVLKGLTQDLYPAAEVRVTFTFAKAGTVTMWVPVQISATKGNNETIPPVSGGE